MKTVKWQLIIFIILSLLCFSMYSQTYKENFLMGLEYGVKGKFVEAENLFRKSNFLNSQYIPVKRGLDLINDYKEGKVSKTAAKYLFKGIKDKHSSNWNSAIINFFKAVKKAPKYYYAHHNLGLAYYEKGMNDASIKYFKNAISLNSNYPYTHNNLGLAYDLKGLYMRAIKSYKNALSIDPDYYKAYNNMGASYLYINQFHQAMDCFRKAININPNYTLGMRNYDYCWQKVMGIIDMDETRKIENMSARALADYLKKADWQKRLRLEQLLGKMKGENISAGLVVLLQDKRAIVRSMAVRIIGKLGLMKHSSHLYRTLKDEDWNVRVESAKALGLLCDKKALIPLTNALYDVDVHVKSMAAGALGRLGDKSSVVHLLKMLKSIHPWNRSSAAQALGSLRDPRAIKPLINQLTDTNSKVRKAIIPALEELTGKNFGDDIDKWMEWYKSR